MVKIELFMAITFASIFKGTNFIISSPQPTKTAQVKLAVMHIRIKIDIDLTAFNSISVLPFNMCQNLYGTYAIRKLPIKPKKLPGPIMPPHISPITFPMPAPHAAAGPNKSEQVKGMTVPGLISLKPGMIGAILKGSISPA